MSSLLPFIALLTFLFSGASAGAQVPDFLFQNITAKQGLPYPSIQFLMKDHEGFLWIGSGGGLFRFDGTRYDVYRKIKNDSTSLGSNMVYSILEYKDTSIICGTSNGFSIFSKRTRTFRNYTIDIPGKDPALTGICYSLLDDKKGNIWIGTYEGLVKFNVASERMTPVLHDKKNKFSPSTDDLVAAELVEDPLRKGFWICSNEGLNFYSYEENVFYHYRNNPQQEPVFDNRKYQGVVIADSTLWYYCRSDTSLYSYIRDTRAIEKFLFVRESGGVTYPQDITDMAVDAKNNLILCTWQTSPCYFDTRGKKFSFIDYDTNNPFSLLSSRCNYVFAENSGKAWFCNQDGLSIWSPSSEKFFVYQPARFIDKNVQPAHTVILDMQEDAEGVLWLGTEGGGLLRFDRPTKTFENFRVASDNVKDNSIYSICFFRNELWLGTKKGIKIFNPRTQAFREFNEVKGFPELNNYTIYWIKKDTKDHLWISNFLTGLYRYDPATKAMHHFLPDAKDPSAVKSGILISMTEDSEGTLWFATSFGVSKYDASREAFIHHDINTNDTNDLSTCSIMRIMEDREGKLWLISNGEGMGVMDKKTLKKKIYVTEKGLSSTLINEACEDRLGNIWFSTNTGLIRWIRKEDRFENVEAEYGQRNDNFYNLCLSQRGTLYASNINTLLEIRPGPALAENLPGQPLISYFQVFDVRKYLTEGSVDLSFKENFFSIGFSTLDNSLDKDIEYQYKLEGVDENWIQAGTRTMAAYTNVPGGDYIFRVKAGRNGHWNPQEATLKISVSTIFYKTGWFRLLLLGLAAALLFSYLRYRDRVFARKEAEKSIVYFANSVYGQNSVDEVLWDLARNVISRLGFVDCVIYLMDESGTRLIQKAALGPKNPEGFSIINPIEIQVGDGIVGSVALSGKPEIIDNTSRDSRYIPDDDVRLSEIAIPIVHEGKVIGVIDSENPRKRFFTRHHLRILVTIASICSAKIIKAKAKEEVLENEKKLLEYDKKVAEMHLRALRAQMNPHFIFNCLNSIDNYIITKDAASASRYLNKFAKLIRLILSQSDKMSITLEKEMEMLRYYLDMEMLRFDGKFAFEMTSHADGLAATAEIPSMLIQPFAENAVLHGLMNRTGNGGLLKIDFSLEADTLRCILEDNGVGRKKAQEIKSQKITVHESRGVRVTEDRLELLQKQAQQKSRVQIIDLYDNEGRASGTRVELLIPLLNDWD